MCPLKKFKTLERYFIRPNRILKKHPKTRTTLILEKDKTFLK